MTSVADWLLLCAVEVLLDLLLCRVFFLFLDLAGASLCCAALRIASRM
jgi:hypothetical protein